MSNNADEDDKEGDGWSHCVVVTCRNSDQPVRNKTDISLSDITTIKKAESNHYSSPCTSGYTEENWKKMRHALSATTVLVELKLPYSGLSKEKVDALFGGGVTFNWPSLKVLDLSGNFLSLAGLKKIIPTLKSSTALDVLDLGDTSMTVTGAKLVADLLGHIPIKRLRLGLNIIKDEGLEQILSTRNAKHVVELDIKERKAFTDRGFEAMSRFLRQDDIQLKILYIHCDGCRRRDKILVDSISNQSKLEVITLSRYGLGEDLNDHLFKLLCNTSSFQSLCDSNHRLYCLDKDRRSGWESSSYISDHPKLTKAFEINAERSKGGSTAKVIHRKIRNFYFKGEYDITPFTDMNVLLMPYVIDLIGRVEYEEINPDGFRRAKFQGSVVPNFISRDSVDPMYRLLRNCHVSELFSFPSQEFLMLQKDEQIQMLESRSAELGAENANLKAENSNLKAENEAIKQQLDKLMARENGGHGSQPNKRARTAETVESRLAALEDDVAILMQRTSSTQQP